MRFNDPAQSVRQRARSIIADAYSNMPNRHNYQWPEEAAVLELNTYGLLMTEEREMEIRRDERARIKEHGVRVVTEEQP